MKSSLYSYVLPRRSLHQVMKIANELGYEGIEIWGREPHISPDTTLERIHEYRDLAASYGLTIVNVAGYLGQFSVISDVDCEKNIEELKKFVVVLNELGCPMLRIWTGGPNSFMAQDYHFSKAAFWMAKACEVAADADIKLAIEIHNNYLVESADDAIKFWNMVGADNLGFIHDAGNMYISDYDYGIDSLRILGKHLFHVHIKSEARVPEGTPGAFKSFNRHGYEYIRQLVIDEGDVDFDSVFSGLNEVGYQGFYSCESFAFNKGDIERARMDLAAMKRCIAKIV